MTTGVYRCDQCDYSSKRDWNVKAHKLRRHADDDEVRRHQCSKCGHRFLFANELKLHLKHDCNGINVVRGKKQKQKKAPQQQEKRARVSMISQCPLCEHNGRRLRLHIRTEHKDVVDVAAVDDETIRALADGDERTLTAEQMALRVFFIDQYNGAFNVFKCEHCEYRSARRYRVNEHAAFKHGAGPAKHQCPHCDYKAQFRHMVHKHIREQHTPKEPSNKKEKVPDAEIRWHHCQHDGCSFKSKSAGGVKHHALRHVAAEERPAYFCDKCDFSYGRVTLLRRHQRTCHQSAVAHGRFMARRHAEGRRRQVARRQAPDRQWHQWLRCRHCHWYRAKFRILMEKHVERHHANVNVKEAEGEEQAEAMHNAEAEEVCYEEDDVIDEYDGDGGDDPSDKDYVDL